MRYWPLGILVIFVAVIVGMSQYANSTKQSHEERARQAKAAAVAKGDDSKAGNDSEDTYKPPVWARYFTWPEGVGAWAVVLTLIVIAWQSIETRAAAKATESSVLGVEKQSALIEQQIAIGLSKERARLSVEAGKSSLGETYSNLSGPWSSYIELTNLGPSNAYILRSGGKFSVEEFAPTISNADDFLELDFHRKVILPSVDPVYIPFWLEVEDHQIGSLTDGIASGIVGLYMCGFIEYESLGTKWHLDFWYKWMPNDPEKGTSYLERVAEGWWQPTQKECNREYQLSPN